MEPSSARDGKEENLRQHMKKKVFRLFLPDKFFFLFSQCLNTAKKIEHFFKAEFNKSFPINISHFGCDTLVPVLHSIWQTIAKDYIKLTSSLSSVHCTCVQIHFVFVQQQQQKKMNASLVPKARWLSIRILARLSIHYQHAMKQRRIKREGGGLLIVCDGCEKKTNSVLGVGGRKKVEIK